MRLIVALLLLLPCSAAAQDRIPVSVSQTGLDQIGLTFASAFKRELARSSHYELMPSGGVNDGLRFYVELITIDVGGTARERGRRSAISVVIQEMGLPNSFPVGFMWYHKAIVVDSQATGKLAKDLIDDMEARWCNTLHDSVGGCPKEKL
jgi:hypothetical protein